MFDLHGHILKVLSTLSLRFLYLSFFRFDFLALCSDVDNVGVIVVYIDVRTRLMQKALWLRLHSILQLQSYESPLLW
jgi:hypothetical protein